MTIGYKKQTAWRKYITNSAPGRLALRLMGDEKMLISPLTSRTTTMALT